MSKNKLVDSNHIEVETQHQEISDDHAARLAILSESLPDDNPSPSPFHVWDGNSWILANEHERNMLDAMKSNITTKDYDDQLAAINEKATVEQGMLTEWEASNGIN